MARSFSCGQYRGFTLFEVIISVGIVVILGAVVVYTVNPVEKAKEIRDNKRLKELNELEVVLTLALLESSSVPQGAANTIYLSVPDGVSGSTNCSGLGLTPPAGWAYECKGAGDYRNVNGAGWLPIDLSAIFFSKPPFSSLPVDPKNNAAAGLYYAYIPGVTCSGFVFTAKFESKKHEATAMQDSGRDSARYETGKNPLCWAQAFGL